ncbi:hypothetical protein F2Q68_00028568 [Brassica cretica]|uniref:Uncharacterized protein n=1 Tax=Brassica cretica TaxID=69181 RepID=A0A8S9GA60_BRACR|nr:hypothetical protein F2Q68_00028568 [Brassica cretica]
MGNCALKPKVLTSADGAPALEEFETLLLGDQKAGAAKSLRNLFLQAFWNGVLKLFHGNV